MSISFSAYCEPPSDAEFSSARIGALCFGDLPFLQLPEQLPRGALVGFDFYPTVPDSIRATTLVSTDWVPDQEDLKPVLDALPAAFANGSRAVVLKIKRPSAAKREVLTCHFKKVQLFRTCNIYRQRIIDCTALFDLVASDAFPLSAADTTRFSRLRLTGRVHGLTTYLTWNDLTALLGETYVWDDVIDARGELVQASLARLAYPVDFSGVTRIWAPSAFILTAIELSQQLPRAYDASILALRRLIHSRQVTELLVVHIVNAHASLYHWTRSETLGFGDSLGHSPLAGVVDAMNWVLQGLDVPILTGYHSIPLPRQPDTSGSCVIACCNTAERILGTTSDVWSHQTSPAFRARMLLDFIQWSNLFDDDFPVDASNYGLRPSTTLSPSGVSYESQKALDLWDVRWPNESHPALRARVPTIPLSKFSYLYLPEAASWDSTATAMETIPPLLPSALPASEPINSSGSHGSQSLAKFKTEDSEIEIPPDTSFSDLTWSPASDRSIKVEPVDAVLPATPRRQSSSEVIDLTLSSPEHVSTPLVRRPGGRKHKASPLVAASRKRRRNRAALPRGVYAIPISSDSDGPQVKREVSSASPPRVPPLPDAHGLRTAKQEPIPDAGPDAHGLRTAKQEPIPDAGHLGVSSPLAPSASLVSGVKNEDASSVDHPAACPGVGATFLGLDSAVRAVYEAQNRLGFKWKLAQSRQGSDGEKKKQVLRCVSSGCHVERHLMSVDPADHRKSRTIKKGCTAHVNLNRSAVTGLWTVTTAMYEHNHPRVIQPGTSVTRPATPAERKLIEEYAADHTFSRRHIAQILERSFPDHPLESRQITNIINATRSATREAVAELGGDFRAVQARLDEYKRDDPNWTYFILVDDGGKVTGLFWQSPEQVRLAQAFGDVLLNDNTYNRNVYQYSLNIGVIIDGNGHGRNVWYALQEREDIDSHYWVLDCYLTSTGNAPPDIFFSDRHASVIGAVGRRMPTAAHFFCLNHLNGNIADNLASILGPQWNDFSSAFWQAYWSPSPEQFDQRWQSLLDAFPRARPYLDEHIYPIRHQWAWAWLSLKFTAGTRTTGRVEVENRVNKTFSGPKVTVLQMFEQLNLRTKGQTARETMTIRQSTRVHHESHLDQLFRLPLALIRQHAGPFAIQQCYQQIQDSMFYSPEPLRLPPGVRQWTPAVLHGENVSHTLHVPNGEVASLDPFTGDSVSLSTQYIVAQLTSQNLPVQHLFLVTHNATKTAHTVAVIDRLRHVCDCAMLTNRGIPCRHYFAVLQRVPDVAFHIGLIQRRWLVNPSLNVAEIPPVTMTHTVPERRLKIAADELASALANPMCAPRATPSPATATLASQTVYHEAHAAFKQLLKHVQTREQLDALVGTLGTVATEQEAAINPPPPFHDPAPVQKKGRPPTARIPAAREGNSGSRTRGQPPSERYLAAISAEQQGSSPPSRAQSPPAAIQVPKGRKCGLCGRTGHNRLTCPTTRDE